MMYFSHYESFCISSMALNINKMRIKGAFTLSVFIITSKESDVSAMLPSSSGGNFPIKFSAKLKRDGNILDSFPLGRTSWLGQFPSNRRRR